jgi:hypothetical protein
VACLRGPHVGDFERCFAPHRSKSPFRTARAPPSAGMDCPPLGTRGSALREYLFGSREGFRDYAGLSASTQASSFHPSRQANALRGPGPGSDDQQFVGARASFAAAKCQVKRSCPGAAYLPQTALQQFRHAMRPVTPALRSPQRLGARLLGQLG